MANAIKGEVGFEVEGQAYTLLLDFNALCELENDVPGLMNGEAQLESPSAIRAVVHAGLAAHHPEIDVQGAGRLIHQLGLAETGDLVKRAFDASFPTVKGGEGAARPRKSRQSRGAGSGL